MARPRTPNPEPVVASPDDTFAGSLVPHATPEQWREATEALRNGDGQPMIRCLEVERLPVQLVDLAALALSEHARLTAVVAAGREDPAPLEAQRDWLRRSRPAGADEALSVAQKLRDIESRIGPVGSAYAAARDAKGRLATIERFFPELFPTAHPWGPEWGACLPSAILDKMRSLDVYDPNPGHWLNLRKSERSRPRRKLRAAGFSVGQSSRPSRGI